MKRNTVDNPSPSVHNFNGNCWARVAVYLCKICGEGNLCDVCHKHNEPRGTCLECPTCLACRDT